MYIYLFIWAKRNTEGINQKVEWLPQQRWEGQNGIQTETKESDLISNESHSLTEGVGGGGGGGGELTQVVFKTQYFDSYKIKDKRNCIKYWRL